jgi:prepilin-type N-terminal cleavage/methylation domain-containing protein
MSRRTFSGFTLIELMMVVAILAIVASIAIPKFGNMLIRARESGTKGGLGAIRSALSIYYADNQGLHPMVGTLASALTTSGRYLDKMPFCHIPLPGNHPATASVTDSAGVYTDLGDWMYFSSSGEVKVNCVHPDATGHVWTLW